MSTNSTKLVFDQICKVAARRLGASLVVLVDCSDERCGQIWGASEGGFTFAELHADANIHRVAPWDKDYLYLTNVREHQWYANHCLNLLSPQARSLLVFSVRTGQSNQHAYLAVFNPKSKLVTDLRTSSLLYNLTSLAATLFDIEGERAKVVHALRKMAVRTTRPAAVKRNMPEKPAARRRERQPGRELAVRG